MPGCQNSAMTQAEVHRASRSQHFLRRSETSARRGLLNSSFLVGLLLAVLCCQSTLRVLADEGDAPQLREEKPQLREEKLELRDDETPGLRDDDGDPDVGGSGRDTTCAIPAEDAAAGEASAAQSAQETAAKKASFKTIREIEEDEHYLIEEDFDVLVHNATVLGDPECQYWLGRAFERGAVNGEGTVLLETDANQAAQLYMMAAESGHVEAALMVGVLFEMHQNTEKAAEWYMKALEMGSVGAAGRLGGLYEDAERLEEAISLYQQAAELGDAEAQAHLGRLYEGGVGVEKNIATALAYYEAAAAQGDSSAMNALGTLYEHGMGVSADMEAAAKWYLKGAQGGDPFASMHIARCYKQGLGIEPSADEAEKWGRQAIELGLDGAEILDEKERSDVVAIPQPLMAGRPSRYDYIPILDRPLSKEEREARDRLGFDGVDSFDGQPVRYKYKKTEEYLKMDGVFFPISTDATPAAA